MNTSHTHRYSKCYVKPKRKFRHFCAILQQQLSYHICFKNINLFCHLNSFYFIASLAWICFPWYVIIWVMWMPPNGCGNYLSWARRYCLREALVETWWLFIFFYFLWLCHHDRGFLTFPSSFLDVFFLECLNHPFIMFSESRQHTFHLHCAKKRK